ncbi:MAG TPA: cyclic nucleotide-binding domain-containing protein [Gammaproteobacteria bacterium]
MSTLVDIRELSTLIPINSLNPENLHELAKKTPVETVAAGRFIFKKGDTDKKHVYLLSGSVDLLNEREKIKTISAGTPEARQPLGHSQPRQLSARATQDCTFIQVDSNLLDIMMTWDQTGTYHVEELGGDDDEDSNEDDWMTQLLQTSAFHRVPPANIQAIFMRMEQVQFKVGDVIITQGEDGDYFYIIKSGRALVTRSTPANPKGIKLAELGAGDSFGEEALISESKRNATITMLSPGSLMRLSKQDFISLLNDPIQDWIEYKQAKGKVDRGEALWLDVRLPSEFKLGHIKGAVNQPLISMRLKLKSLDTNKEYILCCDTGRRSSAAAFILSEHDITGLVLKDGIASVPDEDKETES